ncbi:MAG: hypothetical protein ACP5RI_02360 [Candidatus Micrarchaeia archaeon]
MDDERKTNEEELKGDYEKVDMNLKYLEELYHAYNDKYKETLRRIKETVEHLNIIYNTQESLEKVDMIKDREIFSHIGEFLVTPVKLTNFDKFIVDIGSGFYIEANVEEAKRIISKYRDKFDNEFKTLNNEKRKLLELLLDLSFQIEKLNASL